MDGGGQVHGSIEDSVGGIVRWRLIPFADMQREEALTVPEVEAVALGTNPELAVWSFVKRSNDVAGETIGSGVVSQFALMEARQAVEGGDPDKPVKSEVMHKGLSLETVEAVKRQILGVNTNPGDKDKD